jgi:streptomycin 6-kinase
LWYGYRDFVAVVVPAKLAEYHARYYGERGRRWSADLPALASAYLDRWSLTLDGASMHGMVGLVLPVRRADGSAAVLKLSPIDPEHPGEGTALRTWAGDGAVRLLEEDPKTWTLLLERAGPRDLLSEPDDLVAVRIIANLLARLHSHTAPPDVPRLADVASRMVESTPTAAASLSDPAEAALLRRWADAVTEVIDEAGNRLLHWDLHYENVLAGEREPWLAIDPKPLAGDPGFDLLPALHDRFDEIRAANDPDAAIHRRFDLMVEVTGQDRTRATVWSLARTLQNSLWSIEDGDHRLDPIQVAIANALTARK